MYSSSIHITLLDIIKQLECKDENFLKTKIKFNIEEIDYLLNELKTKEAITIEELIDSYSKFSIQVVDNIENSMKLEDKLDMNNKPLETQDVNKVESIDSTELEDNNVQNVAELEESYSITDDMVTKHTSTLWKYLEIPEDEPEKHSEYDARGVQLTEGSIIGARVRGKKHKHEGTNCDDWFEFSNVDDWILLAVSDGAGSKKYSRIGAKVACKSTIKFLETEFKKLKEDNPDITKQLGLDLKDDVFSNSCSKVTNIVQQSILNAILDVEKTYETNKSLEEFVKVINRELAFNDFACTLIVVVAIPVYINDKKEYLTLSCQIGDGLIGIINVEASYVDAFKILSAPDSGNFAGETDFITSRKMTDIETLMKKTRISRGPISYIFAMTDGVSDDYYPENPHIVRLYFDLVVNGILDNISIDKQNQIDNKEQLLLINAPKPISYPWINNPNIEVYIQYSKRIMNENKLSLEDLWNNKHILDSATLQFFNLPPLDDTNKPEVSLKVWLDNYVERGSFDDRTMVIFESR